MQLSCILEFAMMKGKCEMREDGRLLFRMWVAPLAMLLFSLFALSNPGVCQERPYFVTYSQNMEEPGNLEIATKNAIGKPPDGNRFIGSNVELEYGVKGWW